MTKVKITPKDLEKLSAYLDGQLSVKEREKLETRLAQETHLNTALLEIEQTRHLLKQARTYRVPRNFTLTPEMAGQIKPARRPFAFPALSISSALATLVLVFSLLFEVLPSTNLANYMQAEPVMEYAMDTAEEPMLMESTTRGLEDLQGNPPIINWGENPSRYAIGMGGSGGGGGPAASMEAEAPMVMEEVTVMEFPPADLPPGDVPSADLPPGEIPAADLPPGTTAPAEESTPREMPPAEPGPEVGGGGGEPPQPKSAYEPITGTGPILGIRPAEEAEIYNQAVMDILDQEEQAYYRAENQFPWLRTIQIGSGLIALITALSAFFTFRKNRL